MATAVVESFPFQLSNSD